MSVGGLNLQCNTFNKAASHLDTNSVSGIKEFMNGLFPGSESEHGQVGKKCFRRKTGKHSVIAHRIQGCNVCS